MSEYRHHRERLPLFDWIRGMSIALMVVYHFCYDLDFFGYIDTAFGKGYWVPFRYLIVIGFLSMVGVSLVLVHGNQINWRSMKIRTLQLALASFVVSLSGLWIAPDKITLFGILQFILIASWFALPFVKRPFLSLIVGVVVFSLGHIIATPALEPLWLHWLGMVATKRPALDYVPFFPWFGVVLWGITLGHVFTASNRYKAIATWPQSSNKSLNGILCWAGQNSLVIYLVHQPLMFGLFWLVDFVI